MLVTECLVIMWVGEEEILGNIATFLLLSWDSLSIRMREDLVGGMIETITDTGTTEDSVEAVEGGGEMLMLLIMGEDLEEVEVGVEEDLGVVGVEEEEEDLEVVGGEEVTVEEEAVSEVGVVEEVVVGMVEEVVADMGEATEGGTTEMEEDTVEEREVEGGFREEDREDLEEAVAIILPDIKGEEINDIYVLNFVLYFCFF